MSVSDDSISPIVPLSRIHGHARTREALVRALREDRLYPSLIFHGPEGVGKRTSALSLAAALVCSEGEGTDACGACLPCRRVRASAAATDIRDGADRRDTVRHYPDVGYISLSRSGSGRRRTRILVSQVRDLIHSLAQPPFELARRVYLLDPAASLSNEAQNALLKTLEEPPPYAVLILIASSLGSLLPTTRSRCQLYPFSALPEEEIRGLLLARGHEQATAEALAAMAGGRVGRALSLELDQVRELRGILIGTLEEVIDATMPAAVAVEAADRLLDRPFETSQALGLLSEIVRDQMVLEEGGTPSLLIHREESERLLALVRARPDAAARAGELETLRRRLAAVNLNPRMALEASLLLWA
jgi:DNA polymerase-3 subunit delta'